MSNEHAEIKQLTKALNAVLVVAETERRALRRVEALADKWENDADGHESDGYRVEARVMRADARDLREALKDEPQE